jgi:regulation of enolase protein 1 (concanavalin A-like superfamily)
MAENLLAKLTEHDPGPFKWLNPSRYVCLPGGGIRISAPPKTDFFIDPAGEMTASSAPYLHLSVSGDFVMQAKVSHPFKSTYDATTLMVRSDATHWAKLCFECTDFGTHAVVSVVTNGVSDDANGVNYTWPVVWLQVVRKGSVFGLHYGPNGEHWNMVRYFTFDARATLQVGMVAQSPVGDGSEMDFLNFSLENRSVQDVRAGR